MLKNALVQLKYLLVRCPHQGNLLDIIPISNDNLHFLVYLEFKAKMLVSSSLDDCSKGLLP